MFNKKIGLMILTFLLISTVVALEVKKTEFVIKTDPYNNMSIAVINADTKEEVEVFEGRARKFGEYRFTYYGTISKVILKIAIVNNDTGSVIREEELGPYSLGLPEVAIDFYLASQETPEIEENLVDELNSSTELNEAKQNPSIQGNVVLEHFSFSKTYYYIGAGVLIAVALVFVIRKRLGLFIKDSPPSEPHPSQVVKKSTQPSKEEAKIDNVEKNKDKEEIINTEKRIQDLQKQLEQIRSEEKIMKLQRQVNFEKQSLKKMQDEQNTKSEQNAQDQDKN